MSLSADSTSGGGGGGGRCQKKIDLSDPPPPLPGYGPQRGRGSSRWAKYERTKGRKAPSGLMQSTITNRPVARYCVGGGGGKLWLSGLKRTQG